MEFKSIGQAKKETGLSYLGSINSSAKIIKNQIVSNNYTYIIYLAPANQSGYNICSHSTPECRLGCLNTSGRSKMEFKDGCVKRIQKARIKKTKLFIEDQDYLMNWLIAEMTLAEKKAIRNNFDFSVRLNGTSDIDWAKIKLNGQNIFNIFPNTVFYDYTKNPQKIFNDVTNYHLTFSYSGHNAVTCKKLLSHGYNIAVVFDTKKGEKLPNTFMGYPVIDGDLTDFRPNDEKGVVVGLRWKKIADKKIEKEILNSPFVVKA